jgi:tRNA-specific 2-thiouridylase
MKAHPLDPHRVVVGISGGVDSAVALARLQAQGYDVHAVTLRTWHAPFVAKQQEDPVERARAIATALDVPLHVLDLRARFYQDVVAPFVAAYAEGRTPNPCVTCNPCFKFDALLEVADRLGARWIATGHYARVQHTPDGPSRLLRGCNPAKDQSYVLYRLTQRHLQRLLLPLGTIEDKAEVWEIARRLDLPIAHDAESQDLCFLRGGDYRILLQHYAPDSLQPGPILDEAGYKLGEHQGLPAYTIGQRQGLGIAAPQRLYVLGFDLARNALIVGPRERLARTSCQLEAVTFTVALPDGPVFRAEGRIRYHAPLVEIEVRGVGRETSPNTNATGVGRETSPNTNATGVGRETSPNTNATGVGRETSPNTNKAETSPNTNKAETSPNTNVEGLPSLFAEGLLTEAWVTFAAPQYGVSPGQSLVFYRGEEVLGGGIIKA